MGGRGGGGKGEGGREGGTVGGGEQKANFPDRGADGISSRLVNRNQLVQLNQTKRKQELLARARPSSNRN